MQGRRPRNVTRLVWLAGWLLIAWLGVPAPAAATLYLWQGPHAGSWTEPANWNPSTGFPNGANDIVVIHPRSTPFAIAIPNSAGTIVLRQLAITGSGGPVSIFGMNASLMLTPQGTQAAIISDSADHVIQVPVVLASNSVVHVPSGSLAFQAPIGESGGTRTFRKTGAGTMSFSSSIGYSGTTIIQEGTLRLTLAHIFPDTSKVEVRPGAKLEARQHEAIGNLTLVESIVELSPNVSLSVASFDMLGGTLRTSSGSGSLLLRGDVTMTSSGTQQAFIEATVTLSLEGATRTFTVLDTAAPIEALIRGPITSNPIDATIGLIKSGHGVMLLTSPGTNTYGGLTWVKQGWLALSRKVPADLRVGDGVGPAGEAVAFCSTASTMNIQRAVVVEADGRYDLGESDETFDQLTINGGSATPGTQIGALRVRSLVMNGGVLDIGAISSIPSRVHLRNAPNVRIEATSTATQTPIIRGGGRLVLDGSAEVIVHDGPQPIDLQIDTNIISGSGAGLTHVGPGVAQFTFNNEYTGPTLVQGGTLLIDGSQPASAMNMTGGTLGGIGRTGPIVGAAGTIAPGRSPGILSSGNVTLTAGATFAAELNGTTAGTGYDRLKVTGTVALANAALSVAVGAGVTLLPNATLTIVDNDGTDAITGTFANLPEGATVIGDRHAFLVSYRGGDGNDVVLTLTGLVPDVLSYYLAEGATGGFFDEDVLIANPNDTDAPVTLTFLLEGGGTVVEHRTVPKQARLTVRVDEIVGLENVSPSVQIVSDQKLPLIVERSMFWDGGYYGGHTANAVGKPEKKWILAEGFQVSSTRIC